MAEPAHPKPAATARTVAAGVLFAASAIVIAALVVSFFAAVRLAASGDDGLNFDGPGYVLLALGFATATCVVLIALTRNWAAPRTRTLVLAGSLAIVTALSGWTLVAAIVSVLVLGAALTHDRLIPSQRPAWGLVPFLILAAGAVSLTVIGALATSTHSAAPSTTVSFAAPRTPLSKQRAHPVTKQHAATKPAVKRPRAARAPKPLIVPTPGAGGVAPGLDTPTPQPSAPSSPAPAVDSASVVRFVRGYYADLDARRYDAAWAVLSPGVRAQLGPFARWKSGYGRTLSSEPRDIVVGGGAGGEVSVNHVLVASDQGCEGERSFRVTWRLRADADGWSAVRLSAVALGSQRC